MTTLVVDPAVYSSAGKTLYSYAAACRRIFSTQIAALSETANMGGNVGESKAWATSYDSTVTTARSMTELLVTAMGNYAGILNQLGYNHALADYVAGTGRPEPTKPADLLPAWSVCVAPPPSAGGPGSGPRTRGCAVRNDDDLPSGFAQMCLRSLLNKFSCWIFTGSFGPNTPEDDGR
ncbi:hypothetical protein ACQP0C_31065 [Nocardia sp. CA-129566]|uniref:hypothetical protein n=1 Tax=Nocardia sp. CA-129566 TaxID=3239976 RepID=UPI003D954A2D